MSTTQAGTDRQPAHAQRIVIAGASGTIGRALVRSLQADGVTAIRLVRRPVAAPDEAEWHPENGELDPGVLAGANAVVNLSGATIGRLPWTSAYRNQLFNSRLLPTRTIAQALAALGSAAPALVSASAVGIYGSQPGVPLTESGAVGETFLARLADSWEQEARPAAEVTRVAFLRTAPLMDFGGLLKPLHMLTACGISGPLGNGNQVWPWISLIDEVRAIRHIIDTGMSGPVNLAAPERVTARQIGQELAHQLHRPYLLPAPAPALRAILGTDPAESLLLSDAYVVPDALVSSGFSYIYPTMPNALKAALAHRMNYA